MHLHEVGGGGAARQGLESERAGAGVEIEHPRPAERALHDAEPCLAHPIGGGPHLVRLAGVLRRRPLNSPR